jgi:hypothetical protein
MKTVRRAISILPILLVLVAASARAQQSPPREAPKWGGTDRVHYRVGSADFAPYASSVTFAQDIGKYSTVPLGSFKAALHLPSGALLTYLELDYCDNVGPAEVELYLVVCDYNGLGCFGYALMSSNGGSSGCSFVSSNLTAHGLVVDNYLKSYELVASTYSGDINTQIVGAIVGYKLQVSPAPASATFGDVPTGHAFFRFVEALYRSGITAGCGGGNFCPDTPVTRGQMAVFLAAALGLHFSN